MSDAREIRKAGDLEGPVNDAKYSLGVFVDRIEDMFNREGSRLIGEIGVRKSPNNHNSDWQRYGFTCEEVEMTLFSGYEAQKKMRALYDDYYGLLERPTAAAKAPAEPPAAPDAKLLTEFTNACFAVERLGRLLRSIVLMGRQVDANVGDEDGHCIAEVAEVAEDTWERIKPHLPRGMADAPLR